MESNVSLAPLQDFRLTPTECRITEMNAKGLSKKQIAYDLKISVRTVENHYRSIFEKVDIHKATELVTFYFQKVYRVPFDMSPLRKGITGVVLFIALLPTIIGGDLEARRTGENAKVKSYKIRTLRLRKKWLK